ncbi:Bbp19 family protein [Ewingella sp. AOP9-I1-14]
MTDFNDQEDQEQLSEEAHKKAVERLKRDDQDIENVMSTVSGRRFVWKQLQETRVFQSTFAGDNNTTNFNEGQRNAGLRVFSDIMRVCPDMWLVMAKEAGEDE